MGLRYTGKVLGVEVEQVNAPGYDPFTSRTIHVLDGLKSEAIRVGRDFDLMTLGQLHEGDLVDLAVFNFKGRLYAESIVDRVPAADLQKQKQPA